MADVESRHESPMLDISQSADAPVSGDIEPPKSQSSVAVVDHTNAAGLDNDPISGATAMDSDVEMGDT